MTNRECAVDFISRQRSAEHSEQERLALEAHLASCASCRAAREVVGLFEEQSQLLPEDGERLERLAQLGRAHVESKSRRGAARPLLRAWAVAAAVLLTVGSSAAAWWWRSADAEPAPAPKSEADQTRKPASLARPVTGPQSGPVATQTPHVEAPASKPATPESTRSGAASAAELLRLAGEAQRRGDGPSAVTWFRKLQSEHPASSEALLSRVSLGRLLSERGDVKAALEQFDAYLATSGRGALAQEALYGRGRALSALGDHAAERRNWQRLLKEFPEGAYAGTARRRLSELE